MSKELEALEKIKDSFGCDMAYYGLSLEYETIKQALQRLEAIDKKRRGANVKKVFVDEFVPNKASKEVGK